MLAQQLAAGFIAAVLLVIGAAALVRARSVYVLVALGLLAVIPFLGLVTYAVAPRPTQDFGALVDVSLVPALLALGAGTYAVAASMSRGALSPNRLTALGIAYVVLWVGIMLAITAFIALWEPAFAVANLIVNAAWIGFWAIPRTRRASGTSTVEIKAPRERVFAFMTDVANWPRYDEQMVSGTAAPPGPLRSGSRITEVRRYESPVRDPRVPPTIVEVRSEVSAMTPGAAMSVRDERRTVTSTTSFTDAGDGTKISIDVRIRFPFHHAFLGAVLLFRAQRDARRARAERNLARLKAILEQT